MDIKENKGLVIFSLKNDILKGLDLRKLNVNNVKK